MGDIFTSVTAGRSRKCPHRAREIKTFLEISKDSTRANTRKILINVHHPHSCKNDLVIPDTPCTTAVSIGAVEHPTKMYIFSTTATH